MALPLLLTVFTYQAFSYLLSGTSCLKPGIPIHCSLGGQHQIPWSCPLCICPQGQQPLFKLSLGRGQEGGDSLSPFLPEPHPAGGGDGHQTGSERLGDLLLSQVRSTSLQPGQPQQPEELGLLGLTGLITWPGAPQQVPTLAALPASSPTS